MSDQKKAPDNPFALLDRSRFPDRRDQGGDGRANGRKDARSSGKKTPPAAARGVPPEVDPDTDSELFFLAMESTAPLVRKDESLPRTPSRQKKTHAAPSASRRNAARSPQFPDEAGAGRKKEAGPTPDPFFPPPPDAGNGASGSIPSREKTPPRPDVAGQNDAEQDSRDFFKAISGTRPLAGRGREVPPEPQPSAPPPPANAHPLQDLVDGKVEFALSCTDEFMEGHVVGLDLLTVGHLQARHYSPEVHIDLHGLNSEQAFHNLVGFFRSAYYKGARTALVVTGRGLNSPNGTPVLRAKVAQWLTQDPFRRIVLAFCTARREDGGTGALYVLLRKHRKNSGKVRWDAMPADPDLFL